MNIDQLILKAILAPMEWANGNGWALCYTPCERHKKWRLGSSKKIRYFQSVEHLKRFWAQKHKE